MLFRILGRLEVEREGQLVPIRGIRRSSLLARLLLSANQPVSTDRLADDIWQGEPPAGASSTLASHVSLLRRLLGDGRIESGTGGYRLNVHPGELDAADFAADVTGGRRAWRQGDPRLGVALLERGLGRVKGRPLAGLEDADWARGEIARLGELRLGAEEDLLEARLALGDHRGVAAAAEAAVRAEPFREQRWSALMLALYRSGRQADALRTYRALRSLLSEQLGIEPSPEVATLEEAIILQSSDLDHRPLPEPVPTGASPAPAVVSLLLVAELDPGHSPAAEPFVRRVLARHGGRSEPGEDLQALFDSPTSVLAAAQELLTGSDPDPDPGPDGSLDAGSGGDHDAGSGPGQAQETGLAESDRPKVGLSAGELDPATWRCTEEMAAEAWQLCDLAEPGTVVASPLVRALAGRRRRASFVELDVPVTAAGGAPIEAYALVVGAPRSGPVPAAPLPPLLDVPVADFVGRTEELERLARFGAMAAGGARQVVLVGGEPGIGKTTLCAQAARAVASAGGVVLFGQCVDEPAPFRAFVEVLGHHVQHAPLTELERHVEQFGGELARLVPDLARRVPSAPPPTASDLETERYLTVNAAVGLLALAASHRPVLLVIDDLHRADLSTLLLLRHVVAGTPGVPLLVVGTFRSNEAGAVHPLTGTLASVWALKGVGRIDLDGLSPSEVSELWASLAGPADEAPDPKLVNELWTDSGGNPLFLRQLLHHLADIGALAPGAGRSALPDVPPTLRDVVVQRVRRLGARAARILTLAAVIGTRFHRDTLARVADLPEDDLTHLLHEVGAAGLLRPIDDRGTYQFAHGLFRKTLYDAIRPAPKRRLHARVAAALAEGPPVAAPSALARHYAAAGAQAQALRYAELAGEEALASLAPDEAAVWFAEALGFFDAGGGVDNLHRCDLTTQLGRAQWLAGDRRHRRTLYEAVALAERADDPRRMAVAVLADARGHATLTARDDPDRIDTLRRALGRLGSSDRNLRACLLAALCEEMLFVSPLDERVAVAHQAKREASRCGDPAVTIQVNNLVTEALRYPTLLAERLADTERALALAEVQGDPAALFWAVTQRMRADFDGGRVAEARALTGRMRAISEDVGEPVMRWLAAVSEAQWALLAGHTATGEQLAAEARRIGTAHGQPDAVAYHASQLSNARWQQGRLGELAMTFETVAGDDPDQPVFTAALIRAWCHAGRMHDARLLLDAGAADGFAGLRQDLTWTYTLACLSEAAILLEHRPAAAGLAALLAPFGGQLCSLGTTCEGTVSHYLGGLSVVLEQYAEAELHLDAAARDAERIGSPFDGVRCTVERGWLATRRGQVETARRLLAAGRDRAVRLGYAAVAQRADTLLEGA